MKARIFLMLACLAVACARNGASDDDGTDAGSSLDASSGGACVACVIDSDCTGGGVCAQLGGDSYCAQPCSGASDCASGEQCTSVASVAGDQARVCVDTSSAQCGLNPGQQQPPDDASAPPPSGCPGFADPTTSAACSSCKQGSSGCQPNGCFGGWWCNTSTDKCQSAPQNCTSSTPDAGPPEVYDGGVTGSVGANGGTESRLYFAIVGDTRPANEDDTSNYPTAIISTIFSDLAKVSPAPPFVVSTGDYQFSNPNGSQATAQLNKYLSARGSYAGVQFPAMGNHECTGATASNCGSGNTDGITSNYSAFMSLMLGPLQKTKPYYVINVNAPDSSWTAKFVFIAGNAWDSTQSSWLSSTLAQKTTYTFIVRHEPASASTAPGVSPSETIMAKYPYTLAIVGHSHEYYHSSGSREVVVGNGGAPISTNQNYGYALVQQLTNGNIQVDMYDYTTNAKDSKFEFNVSP
ncbi:MAG TPA: metallophosphoesterase [Polyangiaceae bacterium]